MKKRLFNFSFDKKYSLIRISFVFLIFLSSSHVTQSMERVKEVLRYEVSPNIPIETTKNKAEVLFLFEQTLIESGFSIARHKVVRENKYLYNITSIYNYVDIHGVELVLFHKIVSNNYVLERVSFEYWHSPEIEELGNKIVSDLIITPFKAKVSE